MKYTDKDYRCVYAQSINTINLINSILQNNPIISKTLHKNLFQTRCVSETLMAPKRPFFEKCNVDIPR